MKEFYVNKNEAGQRIDKYLHKLLKEASNSFIYKMLRKKNILLNDKKSDGTEKLSEQDKITLFLSDDTFDKFKGTSLTLKDFDYDTISHQAKTKLEIVYENDDILVINKPAGMLSQKAKPEDISSNEYMIQYLLQKGDIKEETLATFKPSICNRLDRNTSGLLIAGKSLKGLQEMSLMLKDRTLEKYYHCIVKGVMKESSELEGYLWKDEKKNQVKILDHEIKDAKYIKTAYRPLETANEMTLLEVHLITGRSHQIRAHLSSIGHPIAGDQKYGNFEWNKKLRQKFHVEYQLLHAYRMIFPDGTEYKADAPKIFQTIMHTK